MSRLSKTWKTIMLSAILAVALAALVSATAGSQFTSSPLVRSTSSGRIKFQTHPHELTDVQVQSVVAKPGGYSGWHSHPGFGVVAVLKGEITLYDGDDPTCTPTRVSAGQVFVEQPGHIHFARNEGSVDYEAYATFMGLPIGVASRSDLPSPGNCPF